MAFADFVHLHVHTEYSFLDGANRIRDLVALAKEYQMPALAITDHGGMFGAVEFYRQASAAGIKPIIGCEVYVASGSRLDKDNGREPVNYHLVLLVKNREGYINLCRLVSAGHLSGFYYKPRVDKALLKEYNKGLIALSGCLKGEVAAQIVAGRMEEARQAAKFYQEVFSPDRFFLEVQQNGLEDQRIANRGLKEIGKELGIGLAATNDCHYLKPQDAEAHEVLLCIQTGKNMDDPGRFKFTTRELYFKSPQEMQDSFLDFPGAIENTMRIAARCNLDMTFDHYHPPHFNPPDGKDLDVYLREKVDQGLEQRLAQKIAKHGAEFAERIPEYRKRMEFELEVIRKMGFSGYFLIVADFINWAKSQDIPVGPGRGSAAGSLASWALSITDLDPIEYHLLFERFLNPGRHSPPDIDVDFCMDRREEVIRYVTERYGDQNVGQIIAFGTMAARAVIRDVGRALNMSYGEVDRIAKMIPNAPGHHVTLEEAITLEPRLKEMMDSDERVRRLLHFGRALEGLTRHASTHAAGVVIANLPLTEYLPLYRGQKGEVVTQFPMEDVQRIGLIKFDFLGLRTLTVIHHALRLIKETTGRELKMDELPMDDQPTFDLLSRGDASGVFQLESSGMKELLIKLKPRTFEDVIALVALYRPGPLGSGMVDQFIRRKHGEESVSYELPQLQRILEETCGVMVYQEQVMQIASALAGFSLGDADNLRRAMGKKKPEEMAKQRDKFIAGAIANQIDENQAKKIFEQMEYFAGYGFNKSHSAAYALVSYQTAYLKAHHPVEFFAALLSSEINDTDKVVKYIAEARERGINILPPDVNASHFDFSVDAGQIRFGLGAVKNVGATALESILAARAKGGPFQTVFELCERVDLRKVNRRVLENLIKCGACDTLNSSRAWMMAALDSAVNAAQTLQKDREQGQKSLFGDMGGAEDVSGVAAMVPPVEEWPENVRLNFEKETLGFYVTGHPLAAYADQIKGYISMQLGDLIQGEDRQEIRVCGIVNSVKEKTTKRGDRMAFVTVEDLSGIAEIIFFPETYEKGKPLIQSEAPIFVSGTLDKDGEEKAKVIATDVCSLEEAKSRFTNSVHLRLHATGLSREQLLKLKDILSRNRGQCESFIHIEIPSGAEAVIQLPADLKLRPSSYLAEEVDHFFGYRVTYLQ